MFSLELFEKKIDKSGRSSTCWLWTANLTTKNNGYGRFRIGRRMILAHRIAWKLVYGDIPEGLCVLHKCDNRRCCNPKHLFLGTYKDNAYDRENKGRANHATGDRSGLRVHPNSVLKGIRNPGAKLTEDQVLDIRKEYKYYTHSSRLLADKYHITVTEICNIVRRKNWKEL